MPISNLKIKTVKPKGKPFKLFDGGGLYLLIKPNGSKLWRLKYRHYGKENVYSIGRYPETSLLEAREERFRLRKLLTLGVDLNHNKRIEQLALKADGENSFKSVALEWHSRSRNKWTTEHKEKLLGWIEKDIIPLIGHIEISEVKAPDILAVIKKIEGRGAPDVARRALSICSQVFRYAMPLGKCEHDVTIGLNKTLEFVKRKNFNCIKVEAFPQLIADVANLNCNLLTKYALQLVILTFVRSGELRGAKWGEINFDKKEWRIPAERMKMGEQHIVTLSEQAIILFKKVKELSFEGEFIFPNEKNSNKVMSENTLLYALYDAGYRNKMTVHGFRQLASTILNEKGFNPDAIERQLSHAERNNVRRAYNHAQYLPERAKMMQEWADYVDGLKS